MAITITKTLSIIALEAYEVNIEVHSSKGLPTFKVVGVQDSLARESRERVRSALLNQGFKFSASRYTVNLGLSMQNKIEGNYDLGIAIGLLFSTSQINLHPNLKLQNIYFVSDLSLSGELNSINHLEVLALKIHSINPNPTLVISASLSWIVEYASNINFVFAKNLKQVVEYLQTGEPPNYEKNISSYFCIPSNANCLSEVEGLHEACYALEVASSGGHNMVVGGATGIGKTMLCRRATGILPPFNNREFLEVLSIYKLAQVNPPNDIPYRNPLSTMSVSVLSGNNQQNYVGEFSLAHNGVLHIDDLQNANLEFMETIRMATMHRIVNQFRSKQKVLLPANFLFLGTYQPCDCSYLYSNKCRCTKTILMKYEKKMETLFREVFDIHVRINGGLESIIQPNNTSEEVRKRVIKARESQIQRQGRLNAHLDEEELPKYAYIDSNSNELILKLKQGRNISQKSLMRILRVARTIADLEENRHISPSNLSKAIYLYGY
ncbi:YifB family Mg chelatase-like AAA ATPase [Taylorella equigenitalis]|uniref:YifB family Mg chelatase-like AAA ATPase n=1 Tax=Taylorella equigenitalis TaxID=29575 RepID=UPI00237CF703|nr:ATP-binding protein [Taylorella equigenitalis]WDU55487.1 ATP-binding protein [Taylorella equigenitalis]